MIQILNTYFALYTMIHGYCLSIASLTILDLIWIIAMHMLLADDTWIHEYSQEVGDVYENEG